MPAQTQFRKIPIDLTMGMDQSVDPKRLPPGRGVLLRNYEQRKTGILSKRNASEPKSKAILGEHTTHGAASLVSGSNLFSSGDVPVATGRTRYDDGDEFQGRGLRTLAYNRSTNKWADHGPYVPMRLDFQRVSPGVKPAGEVHIGCADENYVVIVPAFSGAAEIRVIDKSSGLVLKKFTDTNSLLFVYGAVVTPTHFLVWTTRSQNTPLAEDIDMISISRATTEITRTTIASDAVSAAAASVCWEFFYSEVLGAPVMAYLDSTDISTEIRKIDNAGATAGSTLTISTEVPQAMTFVEYSDGFTSKLALLYEETTNSELRWVNVTSSFTLGTPTTVQGGINSSMITAAEQEDIRSLDSGGGVARVFLTNGSTQVTTTLLIDFDGAIIGSSIATDAGWEIASRAWTYNGRAFVVLRHRDSAIQNAYIVTSVAGINIDDVSDNTAVEAAWMAHSRFFLARASETQVDATSGYGVPQAAWPTGDGKFTLVTERIDRLLNDGETSNSLFAVTFDMDPGPLPYFVAEGKIYGAGPNAWEWDRAHLVESAFFLAPEGLAEGTQSTTGSLTQLATYTYYAVFEWTNLQGDVFRSAPSAALQITLTSTNDKVTITVDPSNPTIKDNRFAGGQFGTPSTNVVVAWYRNVAGGTVFYKEGETATNATTFTSEMSDADLADNEVLYNTGGILENDAPPATSIIASDGDVVAVVSDEDRNEVFWSKPRVAGESLSFNVGQSTRIYPGGKITAVAVLDGRWIFFGENSIRMVPGGKFNALGQGGPAEDQRIASDSGAIPNSPTLTTDRGVFFVSRAGISLLDRSLQVINIGSPVENFTDSATVLRGVLIEKKEQCRWLLSDGKVIVFDYRHNTWQVFEGEYAGAVDCAVVDGRFCWLRNDGQYSEEGEGFSRDVLGEIETGWIPLDGLAGYQRVSRLFLTGTKGSDHKMKIEAYYDYESTPADTYEIDTKETPGDLYQYEFKLRRARCTAIKFRLIETDLEGTLEGSSINEIALEVAVIGGTPRLDAARRA